MEPTYREDEVSSVVLHRVLSPIADLCGVSESEILSRRRGQSICEARWMIAQCLVDRGYAIMAIGRALGRDHSSVLHGLGRLREKPDLLRFCTDIRNGRIPEGGSRELRDGWPVAADLVADYLRALCGQTPMRAGYVWAIRRIARDPALQAVCKTILDDHGHANQYWRILSQARQLGLPVDNLSTGGTMAMGQMVKR